MSEEILVRQGAPTLAGIKTGSLFPCPCEDREALLSDIRKLNRRLSPKGLCLLPLRFLPGQDRKSTRLNSSHNNQPRMPSSA